MNEPLHLTAAAAWGPGHSRCDGKERRTQQSIQFVQRIAPVVPRVVVTDAVPLPFARRPVFSVTRPVPRTVL